MNKKRRIEKNEEEKNKKKIIYNYEIQQTLYSLIWYLPVPS